MRGLGAALIVWGFVPLLPAAFFVFVLLRSRADPSGFDLALSALVVGVPALLWLIFAVAGVSLLAGGRAGARAAMVANRVVIGVAVLVAVYAQNFVAFGCALVVLLALILNRLLRRAVPPPVEHGVAGGSPDAHRRNQEAGAVWYYMQRYRGR